MRKYIPNTITLINLFCGACALVCILNDQFLWAFYFIFAGGVADYADGMVARVLQVNSVLGKELDSLADMVTFGVVPGAILYMLLAKGITGNIEESGIIPAAFPGFILSSFAGLRLARFNLDERQTEDFIGLPTPSCTLFMTGLMLVFHYDTFDLRWLVTNPYFIYPVIVIFSYLLVAELRMFGLKFKSFKWKGNEIRFIFIILGLLLLVFLKELAFSVIILLYIIFSIFNQFIFKSA